MLIDGMVVDGMKKTVRYSIHESMIGYLTHAIVKYMIENQIDP
jgi:hypothetical protein